jgi:MFS family permease
VVRRGEALSGRRPTSGLGAGYWKLWTASVVSNLGDGISLVAYPWLATTLTRDPVLIAGVGIAQRLPWLLFSLPAGALVDRGDRRRIMVAMNSGRFVVTALVALAVLTRRMDLTLLYVATLLLGFAEVLYDNAAQTILPRLVPAERLERANGTLWGAEQVTNAFLGPPLGGLLIAIALAAPFGVDAVTFALSAALVGLIAGSYRAGAQLRESRPTLRAAIREGFAWLMGHRLLRTLAFLLGVQNLLFQVTLATFVLYAQEVLGLDARGYGLLSTAGAVGAVLGSQLAPNLTARVGSGAALRGALLAQGFALAVPGLVDSAWLVAAALVVSSFVAVVWNVITVSLRQTVIPDHLLGRVNSVYRFFGWGSIPLGALLGGALVAAVEPSGGRDLALRVPFLVAGGGYLVTFLVARRFLTTAAVQDAKSAAPAR